MLNSSRLSLRVRDSKSGSCSQHSLGPSQSLLPSLTCPGVQGKEDGKQHSWHCLGAGECCCLTLQAELTSLLGRKVTQTQGCSGLGKQFHIQPIAFSRGETQTFQGAVKHLWGEAQLECCNGVSPCPTSVSLSCYSSLLPEVIYHCQVTDSKFLNIFFSILYFMQLKKYVFLTPAWDCPCPLQSFSNSYDLEACSIKLLNPVSLESHKSAQPFAWSVCVQVLPGEGWFWNHCMCWTGSGITV